jgi:hypothetical protein
MKLTIDSAGTSSLVSARWRTHLSLSRRATTISPFLLGDRHMKLQIRPRIRYRSQLRILFLGQNYCHDDCLHDPIHVDNRKKNLLFDESGDFLNRKSSIFKYEQQLNIIIMMFFKIDFSFLPRYQYRNYNSRMMIFEQ